MRTVARILCPFSTANRCVRDDETNNATVTHMGSNRCDNIKEEDGESDAISRLIIREAQVNKIET